LFDQTLPHALATRIVLPAYDQDRAHRSARRRTSLLDRLLPAAAAVSDFSLRTRDCAPQVRQLPARGVKCAG
jgi:hypothetical protein